MIFIGIILIGLLAWVVAAANVSGRANAFVKMGDVQGKTLAEIVAAVGSPTSVSAVGDGTQLYQWMKVTQAGSYHYALLFIDGVCLGYTHQHRG